ncbi:MAG: hypothetical protein JWN44_1176 [Myxococcales bacterium]|nr:hypothetical protein [Myxococcales bacterium]
MALVAAAVSLGGCKKSDPLAAVDLADPDGYFKRDYVELVPAVRPPTDVEGRDQIRVYVKLPKRGRIDTDGDGRLRMPADAVVERVESYDGKVIDVRGIRFDGKKQWFHAYRRNGERLVGFEWRSDDRGTAERARARLDELVVATEPPGPQHDAFVARYRQLADCASCHVANRNQPTRAGAMPNRATDASGLFVPQTVLSDRAPIERHRPRDLNIDDRFMRMTCVNASFMIEADRTGGRLPRCLDGGVVTAQLELPRALAAKDAHAKAVCDSRRWLGEHLSSGARERFAAAIAECGP